MLYNMAQKNYVVANSQWHVVADYVGAAYVVANIKVSGRQVVKVL